MNKRLRLTTLAAGIALAMGSGAVFAAAPAATQLPGQGAVDPHSPTATVTVGTITNGAQTITLGGDTVIDWGQATGATAINPNQPAGFNVGSAANLAFNGSGAVLNVDQSGNASQIFGQLSSTAGNLFVANTNGIIVGAGASISGSAVVGLIGNTLVNADGTSPYNATNFAGGAAPNYAGAGGDVTVQSGGGITASTILISGGGAVNVDLGALNGAVSLQAGVPNSTNALIVPNAGASLTVSGTLPTGSSIADFVSGGDATNNGTIDLDAAAASAASGTLTNNGELTWGGGTSGTTPGAVVNNGTMTLDGSPVIGGALDNNGQILSTAGNVVTAGSITNAGAITGSTSTTGASAVVTLAGGLDNTGVINVIATPATSMPAGTPQVGVLVQGGDLNNSGKITATNGVTVINGSVTNSGQLTTPTVTTESNSSTDPVFAPTWLAAVPGFMVPTFADSFSGTGDYSITNTATITSISNVELYANTDFVAGSRTGTQNTSTGSVINTGTLQVGSASMLHAAAYNDVSLGGNVQVLDAAGQYVSSSATNPLTHLLIAAGDYDGTELHADGIATLATDVTTNAMMDNTTLAGSQVAVAANVSSVDSTGTPTATVTIIAGAAQPVAADGTPVYAVRIAAGKTVTANAIYVEGDQAGDNPNVILQGTLAGHAIEFGDTVPVSDVFSGPNGGIVAMDGVGPYSGPYVDFDFTGRIKAAPYLNDANNFRYNYLPITNDSATGQQLYLTLTPSAYTTNGTSNAQTGGSPSAVNVLVNGDVLLAAPYYFDHPPVPSVINGTSSAVTGVTNLPNTHLVLQSTGNIQVGGTWSGNDFYWPGYVYLGTIDTDADGNAEPGTLGLGQIALSGNFSNVLPGDVGGASGVHFITQLPLAVATGALITTNANAWFNFGTDVLTQAYSTGALLPNTFFGGTQGPGAVVNYGPMDSANFVTQPPVSSP